MDNLEPTIPFSVADILVMSVMYLDDEIVYINSGTSWISLVKPLPDYAARREDVMRGVESAQQPKVFITGFRFDKELIDAALRSKIDNAIALTDVYRAGVGLMFRAGGRSLSVFVTNESASRLVDIIASNDELARRLPTFLAKLIRHKIGRKL